jgi:glutaminyl-tRNA synthetase
MYDYAHGQSDSIEGITHSICTLEFEDHRPLYDWCLDEAGHLPPQQIEFARLNLTYTVMSKRKLLQLVQGRHVSGWDDPRMPTLAGMRRRGYTPEAIRTTGKRPLRCPTSPVQDRRQQPHPPGALQQGALHRALGLHGRPAQEVLPAGPGREVRLMNAYYITCTEVIKDEAGEVTELHLHL